MLRWRIYYGPESGHKTFSHKDGSPFDAPATDVQVVAQESTRSSKGFVLYHHKEGWYWKPDVGWWCCDESGMWDYLMNYRGPKAVLFGRNIRDDDFWKIVQRAEHEGLDG